MEATNITYKDMKVNLMNKVPDTTRLLRYRMAGITESAMVAYTHKYAVV